MITLRFHCGAEYQSQSVPEFSHVDSKGRGRLLVYDSEGCNPPRFPAPAEPRIQAPCLCGCPCARAAGRKLIRAVRSDGSFTPPRHIVLCYAAVEEGTP